MRSVDQIATYDEPCRLVFPYAIWRPRCVLRTLQKYVEGVPTLKEYRGGFQGLAAGDIRHAWMGQIPLDLQLNDGRRAQVLITDGEGSFILLSELA
jgi:hypothetical protein